MAFLAVLISLYETVALPAELHRPPKTTRALCHARQTWQAIHQTDKISRSSGTRWVVSIIRRRGAAGRRLGLIGGRPSADTKPSSTSWRSRG